MGLLGGALRLPGKRHNPAESSGILALSRKSPAPHSSPCEVNIAPRRTARPDSPGRLRAWLTTPPPPPPSATRARSSNAAPTSPPRRYQLTVPGGTSHPPAMRATPEGLPPLVPVPHALSVPATPQSCRRFRGSLRSGLTASAPAGGARSGRSLAGPGSRLVFRASASSQSAKRTGREALRVPRAWRANSGLDIPEADPASSQSPFVGRRQTTPAALLRGKRQSPRGGAVGGRRPVRAAGAPARPVAPVAARLRRLRPGAPSRRSPPSLSSRSPSRPCVDPRPAVLPPSFLPCPASVRSVRPSPALTPSGTLRPSTSLRSTLPSTCPTLTFPPASARPRPRRVRGRGGGGGSVFGHLLITHPPITPHLPTLSPRPPPLLM